MLAADGFDGFDTMAHGFHGRRNGTLVIGHGGDTMVFHSDLNLLPQRGLVMPNSRGKMTPPTAFRRLRHVHGLLPRRRGRRPAGDQRRPRRADDRGRRELPPSSTVSSACSISSSRTGWPPTPTARSVWPRWQSVSGNLAEPLAGRRQLASPPGRKSPAAGPSSMAEIPFGTSFSPCHRGAAPLCSVGRRKHADHPPAHRFWVWLAAAWVKRVHTASRGRHRQRAASPSA